MGVSRGVRFIVVFLSLAIIVSMAGIAVLYLMVSGAPSVASDSVLVLPVRGGLAEHRQNALLTSFGPGGPTVRSVTDSLRKAKVDDRISGVILKPQIGPRVLWGKLQEIRDAVADYRESGKPIAAFLEYGGAEDYYLASAADRVYLMPGSPLEVVGRAQYEMFFRDALDKVGTYPDVLAAGDYKTAANQYTETTMTPAHREMAESINRDLYDQMVEGIAESRGPHGRRGAQARGRGAVPAGGCARRGAGRRTRLRRRAEAPGTLRRGRPAGRYRTATTGRSVSGRWV